MKYTRFKDIPPFTHESGYRVNAAWEYFEQFIDNCRDYPGVDEDPDFQRAHVWDELKQTRYIEFILRGGRTAREIYWNSTNWQGGGTEGVLTLVDGKQRLQAVRQFLAGRIPAFGSYRPEFTDKPTMLRCDFVFVVNCLPTRAQVLQWYLDINSGGVVHTDDELAKVRALLEAERC